MRGGWASTVNTAASRARWGGHSRLDAADRQRDKYIEVLHIAP
jgi:hypothetical protein